MVSDVQEGENMQEHVPVFEVALWVVWVPWSFPEYVGTVQAPNAFTAVEWLMRCYGVVSVGHAAANACDGSIRYKAFGIHLASGSWTMPTAGGRGAGANGSSSIPGSLRETLGVYGVGSWLRRGASDAARPDP